MQVESHLSVDTYSKLIVTYSLKKAKHDSLGRSKMVSFITVAMQLSNIYEQRSKHDRKSNDLKITSRDENHDNHNVVFYKLHPHTVK